MKNSTSRDRVSLFVVLLLSALFHIGCGATCDRISEDREQFLTRKATNTGTHVEMLIPFGVAEALIVPHLSAVQPVTLRIPNLGKVADYFGDLSVAPTEVTLIPASPEHIGFHLDFEVRRNGKSVFPVFVETEVRPEIDLAAGKIVIGFTPDALEKAKPGISKNAEAKLGDLIYEQIPAMARFLIPRAAVDSVVASAVNMLVNSFHTKLKDKLLPSLAKLSRFEIALPNIPLAAVSITSADENGGRLRLAMTTSLPVREGIATGDDSGGQPSREHITLRLSGATAAELVNWALKKGLVPDRYDDKGKAKKDGALRPGLDWIPGDERPMKVYLWDLEKPCMRFTLSAKPAVAIVDDKLEMKAEDAHTDDIEASAFTKVGVWFYMLWKDPMNLNQKRASKIKMVVAGKEMEIVLKKAAYEQNEFIVEIQLSIAS